MERSKFDTPFTRRDRSNTDYREDGRTVDLFLKFRQLRPYLLSRLKKIKRERKEWDYREEVEDMKYLLSVMANMSADENHGAPALQRFIDRIHEMIRKNPISEISTVTIESDHEDDSETAAPRSPSPTEICYESFSGPLPTARTIPLERDADRNTFFESMETSTPKPSSRNPWGTPGGDYSSRGCAVPSQDIDMRSASSSSSYSVGRGHGVANQWSDSAGNGSSFRPFGRGSGKAYEPMIRPPMTREQKSLDDWENDDDDEDFSRRDGNYSFGRGDSNNGGSFSDKSNNNDEPWRGDAFASFNRDVNSGRSDFSREYNHQSPYVRPNSRGGGGGREEMYDRRLPKEFLPKGPRSNNSYNNVDKGGSVRIDYKHGAKVDEAAVASTSPWITSVKNNPTSVPYQQSTFDPNIAAAAAAFAYSQQQNIQAMASQQQQNIQAMASQQQQNIQAMASQQQQNIQAMTPQQHIQQQMYLSQQQQPLLKNPNLYQNPALMAVNMQALNMNARGVNPANVPRFQPPLLASPPSAGFVRSATPLPPPPSFNNYANHASPPPPAAAPPPTASHHPSTSDDMPSSEQLKEIFRHKAKQSFSRGPKEIPLSRPPLGLSQSQSAVPPPQKSPSQGLLATNQMLSDRNPRLQHKSSSSSSAKPSSSSSSSSRHDRSTSQSGGDKDSSEHHDLDPRRNRDRDSDRYDKRHHDKHHHSSDRHHHRSDRHHHSDKSSSRDDRKDRSRFSSPVASSSAERDKQKDKDKDKDRVMRINIDEPVLQTPNSRLDDIRNRVKEKLPIDVTRPGSKLQQIRQQVEKERFHALGRPGVTKKPSSFDEAIVVPVDVVARHTVSKPQSKSSKDISKETDVSGAGGSQKNKDKTTTTPVQKDKANVTKDKSNRGKKSAHHISPLDSDAKSNRNANLKDKERGNKMSVTKKRLSSTSRLSKSKKNQGAETSEVEAAPKKPPVFRIPKIKRPTPPRSPSPPPRDPTPPPPTPSPSPPPPALSPPPPAPPAEQESHPTEEESAFATEKLRKLVTDDFIKQFVLSEMDGQEANGILNDPSVFAIVKERLKDQIKNILKNKPVAGDDAAVEETTTSSEAGPDSAERGGHQSRSTTRKKNSKRRSSLEKLHDALKEMRFDTMMPLGPRRCTLGSNDDAESAGVNSTTDSPSKPSDTTKKSSPTAAKASNSELAKPVPQKAKSSPPKKLNVESNGDNEVAEPTPATTTPPKKGGTKRKRPASKARANKRKKGPVTRAQAAVKSAIKIQQKDKPSKVGKKKLAEAAATEKPSALSDVARITRSMKNRGGNIRVKVKVEPELVKQEPIDDTAEDDNSFTRDPEPVHQQDEESQSHQPPSISNETSNSSTRLSTLTMPLPSFDDDDDDDMIDFSDAMSVDIDIKDEPEDYSLIDDDGSLHMTVNNVILDDTPPQNNFEIPDTNYDEDLTDILKDVPTFKTSFPEDEEDIVTSFTGLISGTSTKISDIFDKLDPGSQESSLPSRPDSADIQKECFAVVDFLINQVDEAETAEQEANQDHHEEDNSTKFPGHGSDYSCYSSDDEGGSSTDSVEEEPNDFFQFCDDYPDQDAPKTDTETQDSKDPMSHLPALKPNPFLHWGQPQPDALPRSPTMAYLINRPNRRVGPALKINMTKLRKNIWTKMPPVQVERKIKTEDGFGVKIEPGFDGLSPMDVDSSDSDNPGPRSPILKRDPFISKIELQKLEDTNKRTSIDIPIYLPGCDPYAGEEGRITNLRGHALYVCPNQPCSFKAPNAALFKDHMPTCPHAIDLKSMGCPHCKKRVKAIVNLLEHLKTHGQQKQVCSLCTFKTWATSELTRHMKAFHKVFNYKVERFETTDPEDDAEMVMFPKDVIARMSTVQQLRDSYACYADRIVFGPNEIDKVPIRQIFHTLAYCSLCTYASKVRVNFIRHLEAHKKADTKPEVIIPVTDPVNPVPCLERKELMFDKMTNWAGSSHENKTGNTNSDSSTVPQFVLEQFRYVCNVKGCEQITVDEYMLRTHIRTLHPEVENYDCPHCAKHEATRNDKRNSVPVDKLGPHLKLHGPKLYRCAYCDMIHTQLPLMEKHIPEKHPERKPIHYLIRNLDNDGNQANRRNSSDESAPMDKWRCTLCAAKQLFPSYNEVKSHCVTAHKIRCQFMCFECKYATDSDVAVMNHITEDCKGEDDDPTSESDLEESDIDPEETEAEREQRLKEKEEEKVKKEERAKIRAEKKAKKIVVEGRILIMWYRSEFDSKQENIIHGPLWKRTLNVKHIRGIFLEYGKERLPKMSSSLMLQSREKIAAPVIGKTTRRPYKAPPKVDKMPAPEATAKLFICPKCNLFKTKSAANMRVHLYNELGYQRYRCNKCNVKFVTESSLKGHLVGDHGTSLDENCYELLPVDSEIESFIIAYFTSIEEKEVQSEGITSSSDLSPTNKQPTFMCKHCGQECQNAHNLKTHVLAKHIASDRYQCGHCGTTFWNQALVRNHHSRAHQGLEYLLEEKFVLDLTPEFWSSEYGLPIGLASKKSTLSPMKRASVSDDMFMPSSSTSSDLTLGSRMPVLDMHDDDDPLLFGFADMDPSIIDDSRLAENGSNLEDSFLLQLLEEDTKGSGGDELTLNRTGNSAYNPNALAYKCFHCGENSLSVRGARGHWEKVHSARLEERCNYYEYRAFNSLNQLPPCIQLTCSLCEYTVSALSLMKDHHETVHPTQPYRMKRKLRTGHMMFECGICFHECYMKEQVLEHIAAVHPSIREPTYVTTDLREKSSENEEPLTGKLVEDRVRYGCNYPPCQLDFETRSASHAHEVAFNHNPTSKKVNIKYVRFVINATIRIPVADGIRSANVEATKTVFKCPNCPYQADERQKLVTEHLGEHVHTYTCPVCSRSFQTYLDTKFHIRFQHSDPSGSPLINPNMLNARASLEESIIQVKIVLPDEKNGE